MLTCLTFSSTALCAALLTAFALASSEISYSSLTTRVSSMAFFRMEKFFSSNSRNVTCSDTCSGMAKTVFFFPVLRLARLALISFVYFTSSTSYCSNISFADGGRPAHMT